MTIEFAPCALCIPSVWVDVGTPPRISMSLSLSYNADDCGASDNEFSKGAESR